MKGSENKVLSRINEEGNLVKHEQREQSTKRAEKFDTQTILA